MIKNKFSVYDAYALSFKIILNNFGFLLLAMLLSFLTIAAILLFFGVVSFSFSPLTNYLAFKNVPLGVLPQARMLAVMQIGGLVGLICLLSSVALNIGWIKLALDMQEEKDVNFDYLYKFYNFIPRVFGVVIIRFFATGLSLCLFIIPGIFVYQRLRFAVYFVIDKNQSVMDALRSSWNLTDGSVVHLVGYSIIATCIDSIVPIFPLSSQVEANIYRQMSKED